MRKLLITAAIVAVQTTTAFAGGHLAKFEPLAADRDDFLASELLGMRVYQTESDVEPDSIIAGDASTNWDDIGEIGDVVLTKSGDVRAVIVDVGGFLGIGEKEVAVTFEQIKVLREEDDPDSRFLVLTSNVALLTEAPAYMNPKAHMANADRNLLRAPTIERDGYVQTKVEALTADDIQGVTVYGVNDEDIGEVRSLLISDTGTINKAVIDVGGFLGMGERPVAVTFEELQILKGDGEVRIYIDATQDELENLPEYDG